MSRESYGFLGQCNNGYEAYWISPSIGGILAGVYVGPQTDTQRFTSTPPIPFPFTLTPMVTWPGPTAYTKTTS